MPFSTLQLAQRLESAEGHACAGFTDASRRLHPEGAAAWSAIAGAIASFNGIESPVTQSFGLGLFEEVTQERLGELESFFFDRQTPVVHEVSPYAGVATLDLLCRRGYRPIELSNVLCRAIGEPSCIPSAKISVRPISPAEAPLWQEINAQAWGHDQPELLSFLEEFGALISAPDLNRVCFLAEIDSVPGATGVLNLHEGVALLGGAATLAQCRRRGLQSALLEARMSYALSAGCDLAMMVAAPGSDSHRNAERQGFRVAYTRTKWQLSRV